MNTENKLDNIKKHQEEQLKIMSERLEVKKESSQILKEMNSL